MFYYGLFALTYYDTAQVQPSFNQAIDDLLAYKWNGFFEQLALGMDGYDTELMIQKVPGSGAVRSARLHQRRLVQDQADGQRHRPYLRVTRMQTQQPALDRKVNATAPLLWSLPQDPSNPRTTRTMAEISGRGRPSVTLTSPTRQTAPLHARIHRESPSW